MKGKEKSPPEMAMCIFLEKNFNIIHECGRGMEQANPGSTPSSSTDFVLWLASYSFFFA